MLNLLSAFISHKNGSKHSKRYKEEHKDEIVKESTEKNEKNIEKAKKIKDDLKIACPECDGTGEVEGYRCSFCLGRGYVKKRKKLNLKPKKKDKREGNLIGKKKAKRIQTMFLNGLTIEEISSKIKVEVFIVEQIIKDMKDKLEQSLNRNN